VENDLSARIAMAQERRKYSRVAFHAPATLIFPERTLEAVVLDLSLKGALIRLPAGIALTDQALCTLRVRLNETSTEIAMSARIVHTQGRHARLLCLSMDLVSAIHLRRLVELNLGAPDLLDRELSALIVDVAFSRRAVVLLSGGLDSATCLAIARDAGFETYCLSLDYGQRHRAELDAARRVAQTLGAREHRIVCLDLTAFGGSALTDANLAVPTEGSGDGIPVTYVPARNTIMLSLSLAWAEILESRDIFIGVNTVDYSGYPDCRPAFVAAFEQLANLATKAGVEGHQMSIHAPLIELSKAEIIRPGQRARRRLRPHRVLLSAGRAGPRLRSLRCLPAAPGRISGGRHRRPHAVCQGVMVS
jgi:7-cyano-7-deazaguanine synthase